MKGYFHRLESCDMLLAVSGSVYDGYIDGVLALYVPLYRGLTTIWHQLGTFWALCAFSCRRCDRRSPSLPLIGASVPLIICNTLPLDRPICLIPDHALPTQATLVNLAKHLSSHQTPSMAPPPRPTIHISSVSLSEAAKRLPSISSSAHQRYTVRHVHIVHCGLKAFENTSLNVVHYYLLPGLTDQLPLFSAT